MAFRPPGPALRRGKRRGLRGAFGAAVLFFLILGGAADCGDPGKSPPGLEKRELLLDTRDGRTVAVQAELARTEEERARGLMYRSSLADGEGMLFIFDRDQVLSFWMKNTRIPLSIAYIAYDGRILEIHPMKPQDLTPVQSARSLRYALEVPQGWFDRVGIGLGDRLRQDFLQ